MNAAGLETTLLSDSVIGFDLGSQKGRGLGNGCVQVLMDAEVKEWVDKIYNLDRKKYRSIIAWFKAANRTYSKEVIIATLELFYSYQNHTSDHWWQYLDKILDNQEGKINARNAEAESIRHKEEDRELGKLFGGDWLGQKK